MGMLNGGPFFNFSSLQACHSQYRAAYSVGTPDATTHLAEEVQRPETAVPKAMFLQLILGFAT